MSCNAVERRRKRIVPPALGKGSEISEGAFKDMTLHDAAKKYLSPANRPVTHREVVERLRTR